MANVLVCGVYLADRENCARATIGAFDESQNHKAEQRWIALDVSGSGQCDLPFTVNVVRQKTPKFTLINSLLDQCSDFDFLLVADDDVELPPTFLDRFLALVEEFDLSLAQPAQTPDSDIDHFITMQMSGLRGRVTRFVEIGPIFCIARKAFDFLLPFDIRSPMGWGLDFVWPALIEGHGLRMGIVDDTPVAHTLRATLSYYARDDAERGMKRLLAEEKNLSRQEAFTVIDAYA